MRYLKSKAARVVARKFGSLGEAASALHVSRSHLSSALANQPGRGSQVRKKVAAELSVEELRECGWEADGRVITEEGVGIL